MSASSQTSLSVCLAVSPQRQCPLLFMVKCARWSRGEERGDGETTPGVMCAVQVESYCHAGARQLGFMLRCLKQNGTQAGGPQHPLLCGQGRPHQDHPQAGQGHQGGPVGHRLCLPQGRSQVAGHSKLLSRPSRINSSPLEESATTYRCSCSEALMENLIKRIPICNLGSRANPVSEKTDGIECKAPAQSISPLKPMSSLWNDSARAFLISGPPKMC